METIQQARDVEEFSVGQGDETRSKYSGGVLNEDASETMSRHRIRTVSGQSDIASVLGREQLDDVTQLGNDHYMIRRRATKIFVKGFPKMERLRALNENAIANQRSEEPDVTSEDRTMSASWIFSGLYALHIVVLMLVLKITQFVTEDITAVVIDYVFIILYSIALIWTVACRPLATACYQHKAQVKFAKSNHVNNRWLKGVLFIFGIAIIIKDGLEFIALLGIESPACENKPLYLSVPIIHAIFIICQVNFLFQYSKVYIQDYQVLSRFGVMHVIATNLAIWIATIADETAHALHLNDGHSSESSHNDDLVLNVNAEVASTELSADLLAASHQAYTGYKASSPIDPPSSRAGGSDVLYFGNCTCNQTFCASIAVAEAFLFPFVIEFSLVACCLLYVTWRNIGKAPHFLQHIIKPSYKLYRSYKGVILGTLTFLTCVMVLVVLGTNHSSVEASERSYFTEHTFLTLYNSFLIVLETLMMVACFYGFYLFKKNSHGLKTEEEDLLDAVLLLICLLGPVLVGVFNILANIAGNDNKMVPAWFLSLIQPIFDILECLTQVIFILYGIKREPLTSEDCQETAAEVHRRVRTVTESNLDEQSNFHVLRRASAPAFVTGSRTPGILRPAAAFAATLAGAEPQKAEQRTGIGQQVVEEENREPNGVKEEADGASSNGSDLDDAKTKESNNNVGDDDDCKAGTSSGSSEGFEISVETETPRGLRSDITSSSPVKGMELPSYDNPVFLDDNEYVLSAFPASPPHPIKVVAETRVLDPNRSRLLLRNLVIFLLIANACLWAFFSLEGTVFMVYFYSYNYYSESAWTTIAMICRPLSIFFRMHSAACLFEIWSFS